MINEKRKFELTRKMGNYDVLQRTSDGFFDANVLLRQWNANPENTRKQMSNFLDTKKTKDFIQEIEERECNSLEMSHRGESCIGLNKALIIQKGRNTKNGRTEDKVWMHPLLFIDFAMYLNVRFKYDVLKFVQDELIKFRNEVADSYKHWSRLMSRLGAMNKEDYSSVAKCMNYAVFGYHKDGIRDIATKEELDKMRKYESIIEQLIEIEDIKTIKDVKDFLKKLWVKNFPNEASMYIDLQ